ncbi:LVIVD repeat-containing protein [Nocardioides pakistanensis]
MRTTADSRRRWVAVATAGAVTLAGVLTVAAGGSSAAEGQQALDPATCDRQSRPESDIPGRVPAEAFESGRAAKGYTCNVRQVAHYGETGGLKVHRFADSSGHVCAFYDSTILFPTDALTNGVTGLGTYVMDMTDAARPVRTATLTSPAMLSPHESLVLSEKRGLLVAVLGNALTAPGQVDVYDVSRDCRTPQLLSSTPVGVLGHESGLSPDGRTFYASSLVGHVMTAVDLTDPRAPRPLSTLVGHNFHGLRVSRDGNYLYAADLGRPDDQRLVNGGLKVLDVSAIQAREPLAQAKVVAHLTWRDAAVPQVAEPMHIDGHDYLLMVDEFQTLPNDPTFSYRPENHAGVARIINVDDPHRPYEVSQLRLAVHTEANRAGEQQDDPGAKNPVGGYAAHYCSIPRRVDPGLAACAYIGSGLRIFDISDPEAPREVGYFNKPAPTGGYAMAQPAWDVPRRQVWFTDVDQGFFAVRLSDRIWPRDL